MLVSAADSGFIVNFVLRPASYVLRLEPDAGMGLRQALYVRMGQNPSLPLLCPMKKTFAPRTMLTESDHLVFPPQIWTIPEWNQRTTLL